MPAGHRHPISALPAGVTKYRSAPGTAPNHEELLTRPEFILTVGRASALKIGLKPDLQVQTSNGRINNRAQGPIDPEHRLICGN
jgi:hypothetical protein